MYCSHCGKEIMDEAVICPHCRNETKNKKLDTKKGDATNGGFALLGLFVPIVGLILYLLWMNDYPLRAKSVGMGALISVILGAEVIIKYLLFAFFFFSLLLLFAAAA